MALSAEFQKRFRGRPAGEVLREANMNPDTYQVVELEDGGKTNLVKPHERISHDKPIDVTMRGTGGC